MAADGKIRVATVGVGHHGRHYPRILSGLDNVELVAVVDRDRPRAEKLARTYGVKAHKHYRDVYEKADAVVIAVPTSLHHEVASEFLTRGIHCMVEKPITTTVEEAEDLITLAGKNQCILQVGHVERYNAAVRRLREFLDRPAFIECHRLGPFNPRVSDVGVVLDLMIHDIDIVLDIVNSPIASIEAVGVNVLTDKEDIANARIKFESGCIANLTVSRVSPKTQRKIRVFQPDTYVSIDCQKQAMELYKRVPRKNPGENEPAADIERKRLRPRKEDMLTLEILDFLSAIREGQTPPVSGESARDALHVAVEVGRQIAEGPAMQLIREHAGVDG